MLYVFYGFSLSSYVLGKIKSKTKKKTKESEAINLFLCVENIKTKKSVTQREILCSCWVKKRVKGEELKNV